MTTKPKQEIERLREKLEKLSSDYKTKYLTILDDLFSDLIGLFRKRNDDEIRKLRNISSELIDDYLDEYDQDVIYQALEVYSKEEINLTIDDNGKYEVPYEILSNLREPYAKIVKVAVTKNFANLDIKGFGEFYFFSY